MTWIHTIPYEEATGQLKQLYDRIKGPDNNVDNIMMSHSLRPHTMEGHMVIYKYVLHHSNNRVPKWFLETIGVWVSLLNNCSYCVEHHFQGLMRLLNDDDRSQAICAALDAGIIDAGPFQAKEKATLHYSKVLTQTPSQVTEEMVSELRNLGYQDGEILEINQVSSYFSYANRTVLGLGCSTADDILGLSPNDSDDPNNWSHT